MLALIMAGGQGTRLNMGEKPLVTICGIPMIRYVIDAFEDAGCEVIVVASGRTPVTKNWCRAQGVSLYSAEGSGYIADICEAVHELEGRGPLFTCVSDLPCITPAIITGIHDAFETAGTKACSTWVPLEICREYNCRTTFVESVEGTDVCPAGINILTGEFIGEEQEEFRLVLNEWRLAFNINTREELQMVQRHICPGRT